MKLLFCSDIHGNEIQYFKILQKAKEYDALILGGDLCPKDLDMLKQREFLENYLFPRLRELGETCPNLKIYIMFGNDDFAGNYDLLSDNDGRIFNVLDHEDKALGNGFFISGYPFVPITPFRLKDWEKWDLGSKRKSFELERSVVLEGIRTWTTRYEGYTFNEEDEDSIENDMKGLFTAPEKTIYVIHTPPYNTKLDMAYGGNHVGSLAVRMAIEDYRPLMTLHGHIHETEEVSGDYVDRIKDTICASAANHNTLPAASVLEVHLPARSAKRLKLD